MRCQYTGNDTGGEECPREAKGGWSTCPRHYSAGHQVKRKRTRIPYVPGTPPPEDQHRLMPDPPAGWGESWGDGFGGE
jgi:hypothetical protein